MRRNERRKIADPFYIIFWSAFLPFARQRFALSLALAPPECLSFHYSSTASNLSSYYWCLSIMVWLQTHPDAPRASTQNTPFPRRAGTACFSLPVQSLQHGRLPHLAEQPSIKTHHLLRDIPSNVYLYTCRYMPLGFPTHRFHMSASWGPI